MKRVMVVGCSGAGKSTFAIRLGEITDLPVFHMDKIHYQANWVVRPKVEKIRLANEVEAKDRWIFDGGLSATYANRAARADTLIWLDLPLRTRVARILKRRVKFHGKTRPDMAEGCLEQIDPEYMRWVMTATDDVRQKIARAISEAPHMKVHHIRTAKGVDTFLDWTTRDHNVSN